MHVGLLLLVDPDPWRAGLRAIPSLGQWPALGGLLVLVLGSGVLAALRRRYTTAWNDLARTVGQSPSRWPAMVLWLLNAAGLAAVTANPAALPVHLLLALWASALSLLALGAAASELRHWSAPRPARLPLVLAIAVTVACALLAVVVFDRMPHVPDGVTYLLQARLLATGRLCAEVPVPAAWAVINSYDGGGCWFGIFPPGWPLLLAAGVRLGAPWLVNPVLAGLTVLVVHRLAQRLTDSRTALAAAALLAGSPWFLFLGASHMSHTASLLAAAIALWGAATIQRGDKRLAAVLGGGCAVGVLVLTRPFEGVQLAVVAGLWLLWCTRRSPARLGATIAYGAVSVAVGALMLPYNARLTGRALLDPITLYFNRLAYPGINRLGFGADIGNLGWGNDLLRGHSPFEAALNASLNSHLVQLELFGWGFGSALLLLALLLRRRWWRESGSTLLVALMFTVVGGYSLYWYSGADFGPRYWSLLLLPACILTAHWLMSAPGAGGVLWRRLALLATLSGAPLVIGWRAAVKYHNYRGMSTALADLSRRQGWTDDLVLLRGDSFADYSMGFVLDRPRPDPRHPIFLRDVPPADVERLRQAFPTRRLWVVNGPSITGGEPRVVSGPIAPLEGR